MMRGKTDILTALLVGGLGGFFLLQASMIVSSQGDLVGPRLVPMVVAALIMVLAALQLGLALIDQGQEGRAQGKERSPGSENALAPAIRMIAVIALGFAYIWLFAAVGYLIATALVLVALLVMFGNRSPMKVVLITLAASAVYYTVFIRLMGIHDFAGWLIDVSTLGLG